MRNVLEWLDHTAQHIPDKLAVCDIEESLTFAKLRERSLEVGTWIAERSVPRTPVALLLEKSATCLAAMLGIVRAGCFYAVIDTNQPAERVASIMSTLEPTIVLTDHAHKQTAHDLLGSLDIAATCIEDISAHADNTLLERIAANARDIDPLYVNFTSGSTGAPKGVAISHRSVIDFIGDFTNIFGINEDDLIGNQAPFDFDVSVKDIYSCLSTGATMHLIPRTYFSEPVKLMDFLAEREITSCTWAVSALCFVAIMGGLKYRVPKSIRKVIFSGEVMPPKQLEKWRAALPDALYANVYGPTEITCNCTYFIIDRPYGRDEVIPIGRPFPNESVFLLDEEDRLVDAPHQTGEICVSGTCVGLGYYNNPAQTSRNFIQNPLNTSTRETIYRTGDLGTWNEEGNLVYLGRKDHQIKHLGQRIELGEIEAAAQSTEGISRACCTYDTKRKRFELFFTGTISEAQIIEELRAKLPHYMVPNKAALLESMPLTKNGKIDRMALSQMIG